MVVVVSDGSDEYGIVVLVLVAVHSRVGADGFAAKRSASRDARNSSGAAAMQVRTRRVQVGRLVPRSRCKCGRIQPNTLISHGHAPSQIKKTNHNYYVYVAASLNHVMLSLKLLPVRRK